MESEVKRFTETEKWRDAWFQELQPAEKLAWLYLLDTCDACGVWEPNFKLADFCIGVKLDWPAFGRAAGERISVLPSGKWHLVRFIAFQYGVLSEACAPHKNVMRLLAKHGLSERVALPLDYPSVRVKEKDKEEDKEELKEKDSCKDMISALFRRRLSTPWDAKERESLRKNRAAIDATTKEDWELLAWFYALPEEGTYRRKNVATLLNNWNAELDRARAHQANHRPATTEQEARRHAF